MTVLEGELTSLAFCWRIERRDGVAIGFTTHDRDIEITGLIYRAAPGMLPSAISLSDGFGTAALEVEGAITSSAIRQEDLSAGRWDGASVAVFMVDWRNPGAGTLHLARGEIGDVAVKGNSFTSELNGPTTLLERPVVEQTSPECRAELGDKRCRVDMSGRMLVTRVVAAAEGTITVADGSAEAGAYSYGRLRWLGGRNCGLDSAILSSAGQEILLREPPPFEVEAGVRVELREGCDKRLETCSLRFGNAVNFRGEPHLPGMDLLTRYPGA